jgi:hypothetical protein
VPVGVGSDKEMNIVIDLERSTYQITVSVLDSLRYPVSRFLGMVLSVSSAVLLFALLLAYAPSPNQAAPPVSRIPLLDGTQGNCNEPDRLATDANLDSRVLDSWSPVNRILQAESNKECVTYSVQMMATAKEISKDTTGRPISGRQADLVIEPDYVRSAHPGDIITLTHWITNFGDYLDTIRIEVLPSLPWPVSPPSITLINVGTGQVRTVPVTIEVPTGAEVGIENRVILSATSLTGPASDYAVDVITVAPWKIFLPIVMKPYVSPDPFCNGDFSDQLEPCWTPTGNLSAERLCSSGNCFARLGKAEDNNKCLGLLLPGNADLIQTFTPAATSEATLSFEYEIHTQDVLSDLYDSLQVYIDDTQVFAVTEVNLNYGCDHPPMFMSDLVEIPISTVKKVPVTIKFRLVHSDTWYNTYADIRNVQIMYRP